MSIQIMAHIWEHSKQKGTRLLMLLAIADNANGDGIAWPGIGYLARKTRMSQRQAQRMIHALEAEREIIIQPRYRNTHIFKFPGWRNGQYSAVGVDDTSDTPTDSGKASKQGKLPLLAGDGDMDDTPSALKGDMDDTPPLSNQAARVTSRAVKGDIAMSPEPSLTINTTITNTSMTYPEIWAETLEILKLQMPETTWERYLKRTRVSPRSNGKLVVVVAQPAQIEMLRTRMLAKIQAAVETVAGRAIPVEIE